MSGQRPAAPAGQGAGGQGIQAQTVTVSDATRAPFPWPGGKRRWAELIWQKLGDPGVYVEPFAGSLAVLLHRREPCPREIVCDTDGLICNFWRALRDDPERVAYWAAWPTIHQDLTARHVWLREWRAENAHKVEADPHFHDAKVAGWWVWGLSNWIGGGWCADSLNEKMPIAQFGGGGRGVQAQRGPHEKRPRVGHGPGNGVAADRGAHDKRPQGPGRTGFSGAGVQAQRGGPDKRPMVDHKGGGTGVTAERTGTGDILDGTRWQPWFAALAKRLERVVVLNRSWESAVTPSLLQQTPSAPKPPVGIFLDPPYLTDDRDASLYHGDADADAVARAAYEWAVAHGEHFRIAYACHAGDFPVPDGWQFETLSFAGIRDPERRQKRDLMMFSPACRGQLSLLDSPLGGP